MIQKYLQLFIFYFILILFNFIVFYLIYICGIKCKK